jgi:PKD repeat protein
MTTRTVNQRLRTGGWYSVGTYTFGTTASVKLNDRTGEPYLSTMIAFDAIKFVRKNQPPTCSLYANPKSGNLPLTVTFYMSASDPDGSISAWVLDVNGDGNADYQGYGNPPSTKTHTYTTAGSYNVILGVIDDEGETAFAFDTVNVYDFSITASPTSLTIKQGYSYTSVITITSIGGFNQPVQLSISGVPSGVTASFSPQQITPPAGGSASSTLTISVSYSATPGDYTLTVTGTSGTIVRSVYIYLKIPPIAKQPPICSLSASPTSGTAPLDVTFSMSASDPDGYIASWRLDVNNDGIAEFSGSGSPPSTLQYTYQNPGTYIAKLTATDNDGLTAEDTEIIEVTDFSISASPTSLTIQQGSLGNSTITVTSINGFNQPVQLSVSGAPSGVTATLSPSQVTPPAGGTATSTLTVSVSTTATLGNYTLTVTGTSGALTHTKYISLEITAVPPPPNQPPNPPALLNQYKTDGTEITVGGVTVEDTVVFKGIVSDPDGDHVKLQVELRGIGEYGGEFNETAGGFKESGLVQNGNEAVAYVFGLNDGGYHWRARAIDEHGSPSEWVDFGNNEIYWADFAVDKTPPETYIDSGPSGIIHFNSVTFTCSGWDNVTPFYYLRYSYYLEGYDSDWSDWTYSDRRSYTDLPDGDYTFKVKAKDEAGHVDLTPAERSFTVRTLITQDDVDFSGLDKLAASFAEYTATSYPFPIFVQGSVDGYDQKVNIVLLSSKPRIEAYRLVKIRTPKVEDSRYLELNVVFESSPTACLRTSIQRFIEQEFESWRSEFGKKLFYEIASKVFERLTDISPTGVSFLLSYVDCVEHGMAVTLRGWTPGEDYLVFLPVGFNLAVEPRRDFTDAPCVYTTSPWFFCSDLPGQVQGEWKGIISDNVRDIYVPIEETESFWAKFFGFHSSGELRVYDSYGRVTGLVNGQIREDIPHSRYNENNNTISIFFPTDSYTTEVKGIATGTYTLEMVSVANGEVSAVTATAIPTSSGAAHQYTVDWDALSLGEEGVTVQVDSDGDGVFEHTFTSDSELTQSEFLAQMAFYTFSIVWGAETFIVSVESNSTVSNFIFSQPDKEISFNVTGEDGTIGFCNVTIPKALLYGEPWTVLIDGAPVPTTITENATHNSLYFTYTHSTHEIQIIGTWVIAPPSPTYSLTITTTVGGTTDPAPGTYSYTANSSVQVTAIPDANYLFDHWELDTVNVGSANPYTVLMDNNHTLKAVFTYSPPPPPLSASVNPLSASILVGQSVTFTSTVSGGVTPYSYQWYLNGAPVSGATSASWTFTPTSSGVYYVHLRVTDAKANTAQSESARITVAAVTVETATGTGFATFSTDLGTIENIVAVSEAALPEAGKPNLTFPHGLFSFRIVGLTPGASVTVTITLPSNMPVGTQYWKYQTGKGWYQIPIGDDGDNIITIRLTDGGLGDGDGQANRVIVDPGGPGSPPPPPLPPPVGGVWVPINKFQLLAPWIGLASVITLAAVSIVYVKHRKKQRN